MGNKQWAISNGQRTNIQYPASSIQYPVSSILHPVSSILHLPLIMIYHGQLNTIALFVTTTARSGRLVFNM